MVWAFETSTPLPVINFIQQGCTSWSFLDSSTNYRPMWTGLNMSKSRISPKGFTFQCHQCLNSAGHWSSHCDFSLMSSLIFCHGIQLSSCVCLWLLYLKLYCLGLFLKIVAFSSYQLQLYTTPVTSALMRLMQEELYWYSNLEYAPWVQGHPGQLSETLSKNKKFPL